MEIISPASYLGSSNWSFEESKAANWTPEENKRFENALALFDKDTPDRWYNVARMIPGKTVSDVMRQYRELVEDVSDIEAGLIPIPGYMANSFTLEWVSAHGYDELKQFYAPGGKRHASARSSDHERKKGVPWTEEEHRQFLLGLKKYGKGDWRSISRNFVTTRTPTQVASHAQKYFIRQHSGGKDKRRSSIHDITTVNVSDQNKSSPPFEHKRSPSTDIKSSSLVLKPAQNSNVNGFRLPQSFYNYGSLPNDVGGGTMAFSLSDRSSATESVPHQRSGFEQKPRDRNAQYSISLHGFQLGDYNTVFQM